MKKLLYILPLAAAVFLTSCGDDDENNAPSGTPNGGMSAKVNGTLITFPADNIVTSSSGTSHTFGGFRTQGSVNETLSFTVTNVTGTGTFTGNAVMGNYGMGQEAWMTPMDSTKTASVTITKWDETNSVASGTFFFTATGVGGAAGTKTVTEGTFNNVEF